MRGNHPRRIGRSLEQLSGSHSLRRSHHPARSEGMKSWRTQGNALCVLVLVSLALESVLWLAGEQSSLPPLMKIP